MPLLTQKHLIEHHMQIWFTGWVYTHATIFAVGVWTYTHTCVRIVMELVREGTRLTIVLVAMIHEQ